MVSSDEYICKPASGKAADTAVASAIDASQPAMRSVLCKALYFSPDR